VTIREERAARARELREQGLPVRVIADRLGVRPKTVYVLLSDPDGSKLKARKDSYRGRCGECGKATDGSNGSAQAPELCRDCRGWGEEGIVEAIRRWADEHGGLPPTGTEWRASGPGHPCAATVSVRLGWNRALLKAGFDLRVDRRPGTQETVERMLREGASVRDVAEHFGWSKQAVYRRLRYRGLRVADLRQARP
jgi:transposase